MRAFSATIGPGLAGTYDTVRMMQQIVRQSLALPLVRHTASSVVTGLNGRNTVAQAQAIRGWVDHHTVFLRDPRGTELLHTPLWLLREIGRQGFGQVDCDDVAMLAAALGMAIGLRARFALVGRGHGFEHVFTELGDPAGRRWIEQDTTRPSQDLQGPFTISALEV